MNTLANKITIFRVLMIPVFLVLVYAGLPYWALGVFIAASLSDFADGYVARRYNQVTNFGKFMDPLADKVLVVAAMCFFVDVGRMPGWALAVVLLREFAVSGLRLVAVEQGRVIAAAKSGKVKTAVTMLCLCLMLATRAPGIGESAPDLPAQLSTALILLTTVYSGAEYFWKNRDVFKESK
ncbi:MAG: CDP-diacylglycerol--glycerol-3-phosphate 3-phosphatidyltransferase [Oscillospiraceae bacterium]|nr:CDP-diacylglycerol--glycerol-3-phosphate 3-phosphatidyltransferase [Oscillospiraceae bacterium]